MAFDIPKENTVEELQAKIALLQEEITRKQNLIEQLKKENALIMSTAIRNAQKHVELKDAVASAGTKKTPEQ